jgi:hypothetical protein
MLKGSEAFEFSGFLASQLPSFIACQPLPMTYQL